MKSRGLSVLAFLLLAFAAGRVLAAPAAAPADYAPYPDPDAGYVTDRGGLLTEEQEEDIEQRLRRVESETGVEIIVMTIASVRDYPGTPNESIEKFATGLFDRYRIGNMPENNGVLLLVAVNDRKARIELGAGYGRRCDHIAARIMDEEIIPHFRRGDYAVGVVAGVDAIVREFGGLALPGRGPGDGGRDAWRWVLIAGIVAVSATLVVNSLYRRGKRGWGWVVAGFIIIGLLLLFHVIRILVLAIVTVGRSSGGSSSSWSSGGLGGFGGGFSGGGGATGSW